MMRVHRYHFIVAGLLAGMPAAVLTARETASGDAAREQELDRGIAAYTRTMRRFPPRTNTHFKARYNRACALLERGRTDKALADYSRYITLRPRDWKGYLERATIYKKIGKKGLADADAATAVKLRRQARRPKTQPATKPLP